MAHRRTIMIAAAGALTAPITRVALAAPSVGDTLAGAEKLIHRFERAAQWQGVRNLVGAARAVLLAPGVNSGGFIVAGSYGNGIVVARRGAQWSDPVFMKLRSVSVGLQGGAQEVDMTTILMSDAAVQRLITGGINAGGSGGLTLGELGVRGGTGGSYGGGVETITVATSEGAYAGGGFEGMQLSLDADANKAAYGAAIDAARTLGSPGGRLKQATGLRAALANATRASIGV